MNNEKKNEYYINWSKKNKDKIKAKSRRYYLKHKEKLINKEKLYYKKNIKEILSRMREYNRKKMSIPEEREKRYKKCREIYYPKQKRRLSIYRRRHTLKVRLLMLNFLGGIRCKRCGFSDYRALQIDHTFDDGSEERKTRLTSSQKKYFIKIKNNPERYQVLCANCNSIKRAEYFDKKLDNKIIL